MPFGIRFGNSEEGDTARAPSGRDPFAEAKPRAGSRHVTSPRLSGLWGHGARRLRCLVEAQQGSDRFAHGWLELVKPGDAPLRSPTLAGAVLTRTYPSRVLRP